MSYRGSQLEAYLECANKYALSRTSGDGQPIIFSSPETDRGTAVHKAIEVYLRSIYEGELAPVAKEKAMAAVAALRGLLSEEGLQQAKGFLYGVFDQPWPERTDDSVWMLETPFGFGPDWTHLVPVPDARYTGRIDFAYWDWGTGHGFVRDFKTSMLIDPIGDLKSGPKNLGYALALRRLMEANHEPVERITIERHYTTLGKVQRYTLGMEALDAIPAEMDRIIAVMESDKVMAPRPQVDRCVSCFQRTSCAAYTATGIDAIEVRSEESAREAAEFLGIMGARLKDTTEALRKWISSNGPVSLGAGRRMTLKAHEKRSVRRDVADVLRTRFGMDDAGLLRLANFTVTSLDRGLDEEVVKELVDVNPESRMTVEKEA